MTTLLTAPSQLDLDSLELSGDAYRHWIAAHRLAVGTELRVVDGQGRTRWGRLTRIERQCARVELGAEAPGNEPARKVELIVATLRRERASWLVEKATEVGVSAIRFLASERAPRHYGDASLARLRRVAGAAVEQCQRATVPEISGVHPWKDLPALLHAATVRLYLDPQASPRSWPVAADERWSALIGPEGGWTPMEAAELATLNCFAVSLGPRILRIETAALVAAAQLLLPEIT